MTLYPTSLTDGWFSLLLLAAPLLFVLALTAVILAVAQAARRTSRRRDAAAEPLLAADNVRSHARLTAWPLSLLAPGLLALTAIGFALLSQPGPEGAPGAVMAALAIGGCCGMLALAESTWPGSPGTARTAELRRRHAAALVRGWERPVAWSGLALALLGLVAVAAQTVAVTASQLGPLGHYVDESGNALHQVWEGLPPVRWQQEWLPLTLAAVVALLAVGAAELSLRRIAARPALIGVPPELDTEARRCSARRVTRALQLFAAAALGTTTALVLAVPGPADWIYVGGDGLTPPWGTPSHTGLWWLLVIVGALGAGGLVAAAIWPSRPRLDWNAGL